MLRSMTGFGRAVKDSSWGRIAAEIQSVNRKYLEVSVSAPKEFSQFEPELRKKILKAVSRGQVSLKIYLDPTASGVSSSLPDPEILKELKKSWENIAKAAGVNSQEITLSFLMQYLPPQMRVASDQDLKAFNEGIDEAITAFIKMKETEGKALVRDLSMRTQELERMIAEIEELSPDATKKMKAKLFEKMEEALKGGSEVEERLLREVALFAEKVDISEEIIRFKSHIEQFKRLFTEDVVGRKMDFLLQEMGREVNTIGSKSMDAKISYGVVAMKSELEKIREQVQNIE